MKRIYLSIIAAITLLFTACNKSEYFTDGGLHNPVTPLTNYDYLLNHSWNSFDTLIRIIDHFGLKEEVNNAATFFAPTNYSVTRYVKLKEAILQQTDENLKYTLDSLYKDISADSLRQYLFTEKVTLKESAVGIITFNSLGKTNNAVEKYLQTDAQYYNWGSTPVYSLFFIKVLGSLDDPNVTPEPNDPDIDKRVICQTTDIRTKSGQTVLHVLSNTHTFVRF